MALKGLKVIEIAGLAPAPFCGMIFSDFGADVIRIEKPGQPPMDSLTRGKRCAVVNLKHEAGKNIVRKLCQNADVLIEPFRPGVMERIDLGPKQLLDINKQLIYARLSGFGQDGPYAKRAGHDLNYLAISGVLSRLTNRGIPSPPINLLADFAGGGMTCALGILIALQERSVSKLGQVVDVSMVEGARYTSSYLWKTRSDPNVSNFIWPKKSMKESNLLDGGAHFYTCYETKDNRWMSIACIEPQFYERMLTVLQVNKDKFPQFEIDRWPDMKKDLADIFKQKTMNEWQDQFKDADACVEPIFELDEVEANDQSITRDSFLSDHSPKPAPVLSRTPANPKMTNPNSAEHTVEILSELGYEASEIDALRKERVVECIRGTKL